MATVESKSIYFTHDSNAFSDPKILKLRKNYGVEGYGIYFILLEKLSASNAYRININNIEDLAFDMHIDKEKLQDIISNYDLFKQETDDTGTYFFSQSHRLKMQYKDDKADKKRLAAQARLDKLSPEELSEQMKKAAKAKWDKYYEEEAKKKIMQGMLASNTSKMQGMLASSALNKDKDKNAYKDKDAYKDKNKDKEQNFSSGLTSVFFSEELNKKFIEVYNTNFNINSKMTFHIFQLLFIYILCLALEQSKIKLNRPKLISYLNEYFVEASKTVLKLIDKYIQFGIDNEEKLNDKFKEFRL